MSMMDIDYYLHDSLQIVSIVLNVRFANQTKYSQVVTTLIGYPALVNSHVYSFCPFCLHDSH